MQCTRIGTFQKNDAIMQKASQRRNTSARAGSRLATNSYKQFKARQTLTSNVIYTTLLRLK